jgi:hypothetical protein
MLIVHLQKATDVKIWQTEKLHYKKLKRRDFWGREFGNGGNGATFHSNPYSIAI